MTVAEPALVGMSDPAVELDPERVPVVVDVHPGDAATSHPPLPMAARQGMGTLDGVEVTELERRLRTLLDVAQHALHHRPPADLLAQRERVGEALWCRAAALAGRRHPGLDLLRTAGDVDQVEDRLLGTGAGWRACGVTRPVQAVRVVDPDAVDPAAHVPVSRHGDVHHRPGFVAETIEVRGRPVTGDRAPAGAQDRGPDEALERERSGEDGVHPGVHAPPAPRAHEPADASLRQPGRDRLVEADHAVLLRGDHGDIGRQSHAAEPHRRARCAPGPERDVWTTSWVST
ncbi:hypothetical protein HD601_000916 [Jiangella mangrovi]|uniref:Uncharacterized protein n=1 Tax=Jiangella mangrovi TaxID=1524084 RepID=A0A7W9LJR2_9ACTN|nr:hypothetical protein [Jiangella mangrovi]